MKKLSIALMLVLAASAFSQGLKNEVKGKWTVDVAATQKLPANKPYIDKYVKEVGKKEFQAMWVQTLNGTTIEFTDTGYHKKIEVKGEAWGNEKTEIEKADNAAIHYKESMGYSPVLRKKEKAILLELGNGETLVLKKAKGGKRAK